LADRGKKEEVKLLPIALAVLGLSGVRSQELPQWVLTLSRIKRQAREELSRLPNYACQQNVRRFHKKPKGASFEPLDTLRLEVAFIGGKELFAPAGAQQFEDIELSQFATAGALGTGAFTSTARNLFVNDGARTLGWGEEKLGERATLWYSYEFPEMYHAFQLSYSGKSAYVGERGKFWVDAKSLELLQIEDSAFDIPSYLGLRDVTTVVTYAKVSISGSMVRLPQIAEMLVTEAGGAQNKNITEFANCRVYGSQSVIRFGLDDPVSTAPTIKKK
jgi:hypothetical protein